MYSDATISTLNISDHNFISNTLWQNQYFERQIFFTSVNIKNVSKIEELVLLFQD